VPVLTSHVDLDGETYRANRAAQLALLDELGQQVEQAIAGGGERYQQRHRDRGRLLARERIELLVDPDSPFLELSALAAWGTGFTVGASIVTGIGVISGVECVIIAHDPTVRGGAMNPYSLRKTLRALEIARVNRLPVMNLVESGGADLPTQADLLSRPAGSSTSSPSCPGSRFPPWRWSSATRPPAARTCPACATTRSWWTGRPRCSSAARRW
jgi:acetyl-CoA carboxylase carboxyltransferase component